ncbi:thyroglobulin-like isoform X1 [Acipenser oxyrinchus oxyrinchus]|uniref:Thyroglobulin-like isoform X1 n=1 Tax=Acipenser oxyrinchus oxyrinchus TaxID=40147 RepID=A0AAD8GEN3_ACIOX|nr:thyroglobulin-like isoform X1 [Acipenser oxyrinchus oxyrinchus]
MLSLICVPDSNMHVRPKSALERSSIVLQDERTKSEQPIQTSYKGSLHLSGQQHYSSGPITSCSEHYWIFKSKYSAEQAQTWGLKRCEEEFCKVTDLQDNATLHFTCTLYPDTQACGAYDKTARQPVFLILLLTFSVFQGGSSFSPAATMSKKRAKELGASLASEVSCSSAVPACLRDVPALQLNAAQTSCVHRTGLHHLNWDIFT